MPSTPLTGAHAAPTEDRRSRPRRKCERLAYIRCGPDNGGILLDVSEGGLSFQCVGTVTGGEVLHLTFLLPGTTSAIEATGRLAWTNDSQKGGGLQFVTLDAKAQEKIRQWLAGGSPEANSNAQVAVHGIPESPAAPAAEPSRSPVGIDEAIKVAIPAVLTAESAHQPSDVRASRDLPVGASEPGTPKDSKPAVARTPFLDGQRRSQTVVAAPQNPQLAPPRAVSPSEPAPKRRIVLSGMPGRRSRTIRYALGGAFGCAVVLVAAIAFFRSHEAIRGVLAGQPAVPPVGHAALGIPQGFRVEVLDLNNKRWILSNDSEHASVPNQAASSPGNLAAAPQVALASTPVAPPPAVATPRKREVQLALSTPRVVKRQSVADHQDLAFADSLLSSGTAIDPRSFAAGTPNPPALPPPSAEPVRQQSGLQEAVAIKRVDPFYPQVARQLHIE